MTREEIHAMRADDAKRHTEYVAIEYNDYIKYSIEHTHTLNNADVENVIENTKDTFSCLVPLSTQDAIKSFCNDGSGKIAVLNFASYKNPGGGYIRGMMAQEEAICSVSTLYNVLKEFYFWYESHKRTLNHGYYMNNALYSEDILFELNNEKYFCDVITCAAPNLNHTMRYSKVTEEAYRAMEERIKFIFKVAVKMEVDTLVLGAYGCGVFKNNPRFVAYVMKHFEHKYGGYFRKIIYAVPDSSSENYKAFEEIFNGDTKRLLLQLRSL